MRESLQTEFTPDWTYDWHYGSNQSIDQEVILQHEGEGLTSEELFELAQKISMEIE